MSSNEVPNGSGRLSIRPAAKAVGRSRTYVMDLINRGKLTAYKIGGTDDHPWLEVDMAELREAIKEDSVFVPKSLRSSRGPRKLRSASQLHPFVQSW